MPEDMQQLSKNLENFDMLEGMEMRAKDPVPLAIQDPSAHKHAQADAIVNAFALMYTDRVAFMLSSSVFADQRQPREVQQLRGDKAGETSLPLERCAKELRNHR